MGCLRNRHAMVTSDNLGTLGLLLGANLVTMEV